MMNSASMTEQVRIQFGVCARNFKNQHRWSVLISTFLMPFLILMVTGEKVFSDAGETSKGAFAFICACIWIGLFNSIQNICREREVIAHEYREGLNLFSYILAQLCFDTVLCFIQSVIVSVIVLIKYAENLKGVFPMIGILSTFFLVIESSDALGILVSSIVKRPDIAMTVMPFVLIIQLVFAGLIFKLENTAETISKFTVSKWGLDAIMNICKLDHYPKHGTNFFVCWGIMIVIIAVSILLASLLLKLVKFDKR